MTKSKVKSSKVIRFEFYREDEQSGYRDTRRGGATLPTIRRAIKVSSGSLGTLGFYGRGRVGQVDGDFKLRQNASESRY